MKVKDIYKGIDLEWISEQAETNGYWTSAHKFLTEKFESEIESLAPKQVAWLEKIELDCQDRRN